ncbi:MAG TPA: energy transducer TonB [Methylomirabilota bacterium]|nr:energy transducer TonB [Methylomirabilota bacterium]
MNKTQKRCFLFSTALHAGLLGSLVIGSAFMKEKPKEQPIIMHAVDPRIVEGILSRDAGNPNVTQLRLPPPSPQPVQQPQQKVEPEPQPEPPKPTPAVQKQPEPEPEPAKPEPKKQEPAPEPAKIEPPKVTSQDGPPEPRPVKPKKPAIQVNTSKTTKRTATDTKAEQERQRERDRERERAAAAADAKARADAVNNFKTAFQSTISTINSQAAQGTKIEVPGLGGEAYATYSSAVYNRFYQAWITSGVEASDDAVTQVEIVVARDGTLKSKRIKKRSGVPALDKSVQNALDRVQDLPPFPEGAKDSERSFILKFNLKAKRFAS